jgi:hypothetical protein
MNTAPEFAARYLGRREHGPAAQDRAALLRDGEQKPVAGAHLRFDARFGLPHVPVKRGPRFRPEFGGGHPTGGCQRQNRKAGFQVPNIL